MKLFGKMQIFEKIENKTSVCFCKTGHNEIENMVTVYHGKKTTFQPVYGCKKKFAPPPPL